LDVTVAYESLISACCKLHFKKEALEIWREMRQHQVRPNTSTYNNLLQLFCLDDGVKRGLKILQWMEEDGRYPDARTYSILMKAFVKTLQVDKFVEVYQQMVANGVAPNEEIFGTVLRFLSEETLSPKQQETIQKVTEINYNVPASEFMSFLKKRSQFKPSVLEWLVYAYSKTGDIPSVVETFNEIAKLGLRIHGTLLIYLIKYFALRDLMRPAAQAFELFRQAKSVEISPYIFMIHGYARANLVSRAEKVYNAIIEDGLDPSGSYGVMKKMYASHRIPEKVKDFEEKMERAGISATSGEEDFLQWAAVLEDLNEEFNNENDEERKELDLWTSMQEEEESEKKKGEMHEDNMELEEFFKEPRN